MAMTSTADSRSGPRATNAPATTITGATGHNRSSTPPRSIERHRDASTWATHSGRVSLMISAGWMETGPSANQRLAPFTSSPTTSTSAMARRVSTTAGRATKRQRR